MRRWTPGEDELARELIADGYALVDVAAEIGRTYHSVTQRACRLGLRSCIVHQPNPDVRSRALTLLAAGVDRSPELARRMGWKPRSAWRFLCRMEHDGLVRRTGHNQLTRWHVAEQWRRAAKDDARHEAASLVREYGLAEAARRLGACPESVTRWADDED
jgi:hypothetical protein